MNIIFDHQSVMPQEIISFFNDMTGKVLVDATAGGGGHLSLLVKAVGENGLVFAFDKDPRAHQEDAALGVAKQFEKNIRLFWQPFSMVKHTLLKEGHEHIDGLLCDLGVSSNQLDDKARGFSFLASAPIDMRMNPEAGISAYDWLKNNSEQTIADALFNLGGERKSRAIARLIKSSWPIENDTVALAQLILKAVKQRKWSKIHPATRSFQAIRMAVNGEVDELMTLLNDIPQMLAINGIAVFLSFHSVEDRLIKQKFKELAKEGSFKLLTKKPLIASENETSSNRRARSAKLRAIKRVS